MRFYTETYGCTMNQGETRDMERALLRLGHEVTPIIEEAEVVLVNTCTVIRPTELKIMRRLREINQTGKHMIISGCIPSVSRDSLRSEFPEAWLISPDEYPKFANEVEGRFGRGGPASHEPSNVTGILPVSQGCLGNCTYCITKKARGHLISYSPEDIVAKAKMLVGKGAKELLLTAQDTGCYGFGTEQELPSLMENIAGIEGDFRIRVGMMNPDSLRPILAEAIQAWKHPKVYKFLHLPVQSGSEDVLRAMGRSYTVNEFESQVKAFRSGLSSLSLATDIITGFPGEEEDDHRMSLELVRRVRPNIVNVTRFSPRPGTPAARSKGQVPSWKAKERSREMTALRFELAQEYYDSFVGRTVAALAVEKGKGESVVVRTDDYAPVAIPSGGVPLGGWVQVEITSAASTHLIGRLV